MRKSHKLRLAAVSTTFVAILLGMLFALTVVLSRRAAITDERREIRQAFETVSKLDPPSFSMESLAEARPGLSARAYADDGRVLAFRGPMPARAERPFVGYAESEGWLLWSGRFKNERVVLAQSLERVESGTRELATALALLWLPLALLVGGATWLAALSVFRPLTRLAGEAAAIEGFSQRLSPPDEAEFGAFADGLNRMLARIQESALRGERFAIDAAHELRTPLAVLRTQIETTLLRPRTPEEYVASNQALLQELESLTALVEALLWSARGPVDPVSPVDLEPLVQAAAKRLDHACVALDLRPAQARVLPEEVTTVVTNLLENAFRYAPESPVVVSLRATEGGAELRVADHGKGIPTEHAALVFERFYRIDPGRSRDAGGAGIGLAVCRRFIAARGGTIRAESTPRGGATIVARWPPV